VNNYLKCLKRQIIKFNNVYGFIAELS